MGLAYITWLMNNQYVFLIHIGTIAQFDVYTISYLVYCIFVLLSILITLTDVSDVAYVVHLMRMEMQIHNLEPNLNASQHIF